MKRSIRATPGSYYKREKKKEFILQSQIGTWRLFNHHRYHQEIKGNIMRLEKKEGLYVLEISPDVGLSNSL